MNRRIRRGRYHKPSGGSTAGRNHTLNIVTALRLARRSSGVTVTELATGAGITRPAAHTILVNLVDLEELQRVQEVGGHRYYEAREPAE